MRVGESLSIPKANYMTLGEEINNLNIDKHINSNIKKGQGSFPEDKKYTEDEIIKGIEEANEKFIIYDRRFEFSIHDNTKQIMVKVIDVNTDEVIREIPPEKILDLVAAIWEITGIMVDERI
ncbi:flagellar protein FlaG [Anaerosalibacter bizertensis]|uniref:flagellar protein FlaG n=1 Tax=Anaerosalibacter bizertensis TaxID=932217 RepID=UPI001C0F33CA|nr:flagellar protein FlaG [Anaerosalibacter bizertensis]MBU5293019.1 flagellar protein FlaG [Anaerosalibacter bizertensis]